MSTVLRRVVVTALVAVLAACSAGPLGAVLRAEPAAWAHATLLETTPADGASTDTGPAQVTLRFDQPVGKEFGEVVVTGPDGGQWQDNQLRVSTDTVRQPLRPLGPAGPYEVSWRVVSADGHPVSGAFEFHLTEAGDGTPLPQEEASGESSAGADQRGWLLLAGLLTLGALVLVGVIVGGTVLAGRRRS